MTTTITTVNVRLTDKERKLRARARRQKQLARILFIALTCIQRLVTWAKEASVDAPARLKEHVVNWFAATICLLLAAAAFFACSGLAALALDFWMSTYSGW